MASRLGTIVLILALISGPLAGCLSSGSPEDRISPAGEDGAGNLTAALSAPRFEISDGEAMWIPASSDESEMFAKVWRPQTRSSPSFEAPVILVMTPYQGYDGREDPADATSRPSNPDYAWLIDHFVPRGYAVAFLDVRGTGESGGCLEQTAHQQRQDGYDAVEFLASQPWSNGEVGMYGRSYRAETQLGTAALAPPSLATIVPVASVAGQYEWNYYDGVPFTLHTLVGNAGYLASEGAQPPTEPRGLTQYPARWTCQPGILTQDPAHTGDWNAYWQARELRDLVDRFEDTSVLYVHGLQDWNVRPVAIRDMWEHIPTTRRLMLGQWSHAFPDNGYGDEPAREDWRTIVHAWFDHELLGIENGILDVLPAVQVQDSRLDWRAEQAWPPGDATNLSLHLTREGTLALDDPGPIDPPLTFRENEEAFVRNNTDVPIEDVDTGDVETQLVFTSAPLEEDVRVAGWPTLSFRMTLFDGLYPDPDSEIDAHVAANLRIVHEDGTVEWVNSGYTSARHREGLDQPTSVPEDEALVYELTLHPQDTVLPAGSQLQLVISGSDRWTEPQGSFFGADLHDGALTVPTISRTLETTGLAVPLLPPLTEG